MLNLRKYTKQQVTALNRIFERHRPLPLALAGRRFTASVSPVELPLNPLIAVVAELDGCPFRVRLDDAILRGLLRESFPEVDVRRLPEELRAAVFEAALDEALTALEAAARGRLTVREVGFGPAGDDASLARVYFSLLPSDGEGGDGGSHGYLALDDAALAALAAHLQAAGPPLDGPAAADWDGLRVPLRLEVGSVRLRLAELEDLAPNDLLLLEDGRTLQEEGLVALRLSPELALRARIEGRTLVVLGDGGAAGEAMSGERADRDGSGGGDGEPQDMVLPDLDHLTVTLVFDLGTVSLSLGELRALAPGHVFDLGRHIESPVSIRVNGQLIGSGELVQVEDRVGVRVADLFRPGDA